MTKIDSDDEFCKVCKSGLVEESSENKSLPSSKKSKPEEENQNVSISSEIERQLHKEDDNREEMEDLDYNLLCRDQVRKRYHQVKKKDLNFEDYKSLCLQLKKELRWWSYKDFDSLQKLKKTDKRVEYKLKKTYKRAIDYVGVWDARTVEKAWNWFLVLPHEDFRRRFVELVLKEQPEKNFSEALERVCKAWDDIRKVYTYSELLEDDTKSEKKKLQYCDWLETKTGIDLTVLEYILQLHEHEYFEYAIDYVLVWDAITGEENAITVDEAWKWIIALPIRNLATEFVELVCVEQPEKNFWEALKRVCKAVAEIRKAYTYQELFAYKENDESFRDKLRLKYCDWLRG